MSKLKEFLDRIGQEKAAVIVEESVIEGVEDDNLSLDEINAIWGTNLGDEDCDVDDIPGAR